MIDIGKLNEAELIDLNHGLWPPEIFCSRCARTGTGTRLLPK